MIELDEARGIPRLLLILMAAISGFTVANCYYCQPLLEMVRCDLVVSEVAANLITVVTQIGYALGLFFITPMGDLYSRRRLLVTNILMAGIMAVVIASAGNIAVVWGASIILGACSVVPQIFMPMAGQYSRPESKEQNIGIILSGLLTGILVSRVISGFIGDWLGWRAVYILAAVLMVVCFVVALLMMPRMKHNFSGTYVSLMLSVWHIFRTHPLIRLRSVRAAFSFGSMLAIWSCMAFHLADAPFHAGADMVGVLGLCGVVGAVSASGMGRFIPRYGIKAFSIFGASLQIAAWIVAYLFSDSYIGLIAGIILVDVGLQCLQLSNQSGCMKETPEASSRANTIFMTIYFLGGSLGTFCAGLGWDAFGWIGVCGVGMACALISLFIGLASKE